MFSGIVALFKLSKLITMSLSISTRIESLFDLPETCFKKDKSASPVSLFLI